MTLLPVSRAMDSSPSSSSVLRNIACSMAMLLLLLISQVAGLAASLYLELGGEIVGRIEVEATAFSRALGSQAPAWEGQGQLLLTVGNSLWHGLLTRSRVRRTPRARGLGERHRGTEAPGQLLSNWGKGAPHPAHPAPLIPLFLQTPCPTSPPQQQTALAPLEIHTEKK